MTAPQGRGARITLPWGDGAITVLDDSYNANPASMRAAIALLKQQAAAQGGRAVAVLGDMRELGARSRRLHADLAPVLEEAGVGAVYTAGADMRALADALPPAMAAGTPKVPRPWQRRSWRGCARATWFWSKGQTAWPWAVSSLQSRAQSDAGNGHGGDEGGAGKEMGR